MTVENLSGFTPRNERIKTTLAADPELAADVAVGVAQMHAADRAHAIALVVARFAERRQAGLRALWSSCGCGRLVRRLRRW